MGAIVQAQYRFDESCVVIYKADRVSRGQLDNKQRWRPRAFASLREYNRVSGHCARGYGGRFLSGIGD